MGGRGVRAWGRGDGDGDEVMGARGWERGHDQGWSSRGDGGEVEGMEPRERAWGHEGEGIPVR